MSRPKRSSWRSCRRRRNSWYTTRRFAAIAGRERNNYTLGEQRENTIYGAAVAWRPSPRTVAEFEYEHRYFGPSRLARFKAGVYAPVLVLASFVVGDDPMALVFNGYELAAVFLAILVANFVVNEGESTWFEGLQLLALYALMGVVFFYA
mgnify:CR=1 FL=1